MGSSPITYIAETQRNYKTFNMEDKTMACCKGNEKLPFQMEGNVPVKAIAVEAPVADTKTKLIVHDGVISAGFFSEGVPIGGGTLISDVVDVREIDNDGKPKVVVVSFADGTTEKAVLDTSDTYSLEQGISICITKKLLGRNTTYGGALYNKVIKRALDVMKKNELAREYEKIATIAAQKKAEKEAEKKKARREKIRELETERQIEIQKEAYIRAIKAMREEEKEAVSEAVDEFGKFLENLIEEAEKEAAAESNKEEMEKETNQTVSEVNAE